jgi:Spy/CpxP family protein refolding chaperone
VLFKGVIIVAGIILVSISAFVLLSSNSENVLENLIFEKESQIPETIETEKKMIHSPWAGEQTREIKSLTARELTGIPKGHGVGMALPAELNSYPGPRHVLDLSEELNLTPEQNEQIEFFYTEMSQQAVPLGQQFIEIEREIDEKFADKSITSEELNELLKNSSEIKWQLRNIHLQAHLKTVDVLSSEQISLYDQLRGYADD